MDDQEQNSGRQENYWSLQGRKHPKTAVTAPLDKIRPDSRLFERAFAYDTISWSAFSHNLDFSERDPFSEDLLQAKCKEYKFAVLRGDIDVVSSSNPDALLEINSQIGAVQLAGEDKLDAWVDQFLTRLQTAIDLGADVISTGEFSWPAMVYGSDVEDRLINQIKEKMRAIERPLVFVAGSKHTPSEFGVVGKGDLKEPRLFNENVSYVFFKDGGVGEDPILEVCKKRTPSTQMGERIFTPPDPKMLGFKTPFGSISTLICADVFDMRVVVSHLRRNAYDVGRIENIIVPSYNHSNNFIDACRYLSYFANTLVTYINSSKYTVFKGYEDNKRVEKKRENHFPSDVVRMFISGVEVNEMQSFIASLPEEALKNSDRRKFGPDPEGYVCLMETDGSKEASAVAIYKIFPPAINGLAMFLLNHDNSEFKAHTRTGTSEFKI